MEKTEQDINTWKKEMDDYQKRRTYRNFAPSETVRVTTKDIRQKETQFNPILQQFYRKDQKTLDKYSRNFDIINLDDIKCRIEYQGEKGEPKKNLIVPSIRDYNIISNQKVDPGLYKNIKALKEEKNDLDGLQKKWQDKFKATRDYNPVKIRYYDDVKEDKFQEDLKIKQKLHGQDAIEKLPPSLRFRESIIQDASKPVPEEIKKIDEMKKNAKKRYELRYAIEEEYHDRDIQNQNRNLQRKLNRLHDGKYVEEKKKGFDIINLNKIDLQATEKFIFKKPHPTVWEAIQLSSNPQNQQNGDTLDKEITKNKTISQTQPGFFEGKKIDPPRQRAFQNRDLDEANENRITVISPAHKKNTQFKIVNNQQLKIPVQTTQNDIKNLAVQKTYLNDPRNATTAIHNPAIAPKFQQPSKRIQTSGFQMNAEQYKNL